MNRGFLDKLIERLDRIDPKSLQTHFLHLARERGLLETIFQSIQEGLLVIDGEGRLMYANRAAERLLGFSADQARGRPITNLLLGIDWDRILHLDHGEWSKLISRELEITYPEHRFLGFSIVPLPRADDTDAGAAIMLRDITRERREEHSLLESERLNAIKLLAAGVAHEIGNPLNALTIHLQLLKREMRALEAPGAANLLELVDVAGREVSRLDLIITQFLRAIRPSKPERQPCQIESLLKETLNLLGEEIQSRRMIIELKSPEALPSIHLDAGQIKQAFFNLIRNAFQAMPDGGRLEIRLGTTDRDLAVTFLDNGMGIDPENLSRIFEPYFTTKREGTGLGLMIVQRIAQDHGGQIEVTSKPGQGTAVTLLLPLDERRVRLLHAPQSPAGRMARPRHPPRPGSRSGPSIEVTP